MRKARLTMLIVILGGVVTLRAQTPWTLEQWIRDLIEEPIQRYIRVSKQGDRSLACGERWAAVSAADKTNVSAIFGGVSPCLAR